jgi:hypothetical protein
VFAQTPRRGDARERFGLVHGRDDRTRRDNLKDADQKLLVLELDIAVLPVRVFLPVEHPLDVVGFLHSDLLKRATVRRRRDVRGRKMGSEPSAPAT